MLTPFAFTEGDRRSPLARTPFAIGERGTGASPITFGEGYAPKVQGVRGTGDYQR